MFFKEEKEMKYQKPTMLAETTNCAVAADEIAEWIVAVIILALIAVSLVAAMILFCQAKGMQWGGYYEFVNNRHSVKFGCM